MPNAIQEISCPWCREGTRIFDPFSGEEVCNRCGIVLAERTEQSNSESRIFSLEDYMEKRRTGSPFSLSVFDKGLSTLIGRRNVDAAGRDLPTDSGAMLRRLRTWDHRLQASDSESRNLRLAFILLDALRHKLGLSREVGEEAAYIYRKSLKSGLVRGRSILTVLAAALYVACRMAGIPRSVKEICNAGNIRKKELTKNYRSIVNRLDLKMPIQDVNDYLPCIVNNLGLEAKVERKAFQIIKRAKRKNILAGRDPKGVAASVLYFAACIERQSVTQKKVADAAGVTEVTVRNCTKIIKQILTKRELNILEKSTQDFTNIATARFNQRLSRS